MNVNHKILVGLFVVFLTLSGCVSMQRINVDVIVEKDIPAHFRIGNIQVTNGQSSISIVSGTLHTQRRGNRPGHIDITLVSADGDILYKSITNLDGRSLSTRNYDFRAELPIVVEPGSTVRIKYHRIKHENSKEIINAYREFITKQIVV